MRILPPAKMSNTAQKYNQKVARTFSLTDADFTMIVPASIRKKTIPKDKENLIDKVETYGKMTTKGKHVCC